MKRILMWDTWLLPGYDQQGKKGKPHITLIKKIWFAMNSSPNKNTCLPGIEGLFQWVKT